MLKKIIATIFSFLLIGQASAEDFSTIRLHHFFSLGSGLVFSAPDTWQDTSDEFFQVVDPTTGAQFTSSAYRTDGSATLQEFAAVRLSAVDEMMPYLKLVKHPYQLKGKSWVGTVAEYKGHFPSNLFESHYLVLCIVIDRVAISFTITAPVEVFVKNEPFYRWLLENQLKIAKVVYSEG